MKRSRINKPSHMISGSDLGELLLIAGQVEGHAKSIRTSCECLIDCAKRMDQIRERVRIHNLRKGKR